MTRAPRPTSPTAPRRAVLLALAAAGSGCSAVGRPAPTPLPRATSATPSADARALAAVRAELAMADWLAGLPLVSAATLPDPVRTAVAALRDAHRAHAATLVGLDPLLAAALPTPRPTPAKVTGGWSALAPQLVRRERALAARHRADAMAAATPTQTLLSGSLATFASAAATSKRPVSASTRRPAPLPQVDLATTLGVLLSHLRALSQVLRVTLGQLDDEALDAAAAARLPQVLATRDRVVGRRVDAGAVVPPAEVGYQLPASPTTPAGARRAWSTLETRVMDGWGGVVSASQGSDRAEALDQLLAQPAHVEAAGGRLDWWPGWA